jgi:hypothetical protein
MSAKNVAVLPSCSHPNTDAGRARRCRLHQEDEKHDSRVWQP